MLLLAATAAAQPADPFGASADPFGGAATPAGAVAPPAAAGATGLTITTEAGPITLDPFPTDPTVQIYRQRLLARGATPSASDFVQAAVILARIGHATEARYYLAKFLTTAATDEELTRLHRGLSTTGLVDLRGRKALAPEAALVVGKILDGSRRYYADPARARAWVKSLGDLDAAVRAEAFHALRAAGPAGIETLFAVWADPAARGEHAGIRVAARQWPGLRDGLMAALAAEEPAFVAQVVDVLRDHTLGRDVLVVAALAVDDRTAPEVRDVAARTLTATLGRVPPRAEVVAALDRAIRELDAELAQRRVRVAAYDDRDVATHYAWDGDRHTVVATQALVRTTLAEQVARLAERRAELSPDDRKARRAAVLAVAETVRPTFTPPAPDAPADASGPERDPEEETEEVALRPAGTAENAATDGAAETAAPGDPLTGLARELSTEDLAAAFRQALETGRDDAAANLAYLLAERPFEEVLVAGPDRLPALALGLRSPSPAVRFATADAIASYPIPHHFPGASYLTEQLAFFVADDLLPRVVTCHPQPEHSRSWASTMVGLGYAATSTTSGTELYRAAVSGADVELLIVDETVSHPTITELMQWLRKDERTARLPVLVLAGAYRSELVPITAATVTARPRVTDSATAAATVDATDPATAAALEGLDVLADLAGRSASQSVLSVTERPNHPAVQLALTDSRLLVSPRLRSTEEFRFALDRLAGRGLLAPPAAEARIVRSRRALTHLLALARRGDRSFEDDLIRHEATILDAANVPELAVLAFAVLGELGTHNAQRQLLTVAAQPFRPAYERQAALAAWRRAVADHGVMLTAREVREMTVAAVADPDADAITAELIAFVRSGATGAATSLSPPVIVGPQVDLSRGGRRP